jgi:hypothetical protein
MEIEQGHNQEMKLQPEYSQRETIEISSDGLVKLKIP